MTGPEIVELLADAISSIMAGAGAAAFSAVVLKPDAAAASVPVDRPGLVIALDIDRSGLQQPRSGPDTFPSTLRWFATSIATVSVLSATTMPAFAWEAVGRDLAAGYNVLVILTTATRIDAWQDALPPSLMRVENMHVVH